MTQEIKKELIIKELAGIPLITKKRKEDIADNILALDLLDEKAEAELVAEYRTKEIAELEAEKAKRVADLQETDSRLSVLKTAIESPKEIIK
jgi:hypothetical protein